MKKTLFAALAFASFFESNTMVDIPRGTLVPEEVICCISSSFPMKEVVRIGDAIFQKQLPMPKESVPIWLAKEFTKVQSLLLLPDIVNGSMSRDDVITAMNAMLYFSKEDVIVPREKTVNYVPEKVVFHVATNPPQDVVKIYEWLFLRSPIAGSDVDFRRVLLSQDIFPLSLYYSARHTFAAILAEHFGCEVTEIH